MKKKDEFVKILRANAPARLVGGFLDNVPRPKNTFAYPVGKEPKRGSKSPGGNLKEAAKKAGRAVGDAAKKAVGMRPSRVKKSGTK